MKNWNGTIVTDAVFSTSWKSYLSSYYIDTTPDNWFLKTVAQAFDSLPIEESSVITNYLTLTLPTADGTQQKKGFIPASFLFLYDALLEPYFQRKFSIIIIKEVFITLIEKIRERSASFNTYQETLLATDNSVPIHLVEVAQTPVVALDLSPVSYDDTSVIDITGEGQKLSYSDVSLNEADEDDTENGNWRLGNRYGQLLNLTQTEIDWLNKFWDPSNAFITVAQCCIETIHLYLTCLKGLNTYFIGKQSSLQEQIDKYAEGMVAQNSAASSDSYAVDYFREQAEANVYLTFFKKAENSVREAYQHKRKINDSFTYNDLAASFERRFGAMAGEIIRQHTPLIATPNAATEVQLNKMNTARWKFFFDEWTVGLTKESALECATRIEALAIANAENPSVEHIYYEACKAFTTIDNLAAVKFYLKYIYTDLHSEEVNGKQLNKGIQKRLFQSDEQLKDFEKIVNDLIAGEDLNTCLQRTENLYAKRRKKLKLDRNSIEQIKSQHQVTVSRLNELLQDEEEVEINILPTVVELPDPVEKTNITSDTIPTGITILGLNLNPDQKELLLLFGQHRFQVDAETINGYAKSKGLFRNALIERINDCCYPELDDVLIEETGDGYEVNEFYYNKIINLC